MSIDYKKYFFNFCWLIFVSIKLLAQNTSNYLLKNAKKKFQCPQANSKKQCKKQIKRRQLRANCNIKPCRASPFVQTILNKR